MKKFVICFFVFVITGIASAFIGVPGDATFIVGAICAILYLVFSRKKGNKKSSNYTLHQNLLVIRQGNTHQKMLPVYSLLVICMHVDLKMEAT